MSTLAAPMKVMPHAERKTRPETTTLWPRLKARSATDMESARRIADKVAMMHAGKIVWVGDVDKIDDSGNEIVDQFIHGRLDSHISNARLGTSAA